MRYCGYCGKEHKEDSDLLVAHQRLLGGDSRAYGGTPKLTDIRGKELSDEEASDLLKRFVSRHERGIGYRVLVRMPGEPKGHTVWGPSKHIWEARDYIKQTAVSLPEDSLLYISHRGPSSYYAPSLKETYKVQQGEAIIQGLWIPSNKRRRLT